MSHVSLATTDADPQRVIGGTLALPRIGVWHAEVKVDADTDVTLTPGAAAKIEVNGGELDLVGTIIRAVEYQGVTQVRVVAGGGGLQIPATPKFYGPGKVGDVLTGTLLDSGDVVSADADAGMLGAALSSWTTIKAPIGRQIAELLRPIDGAAWRFLPDGSLWVGPETWPDTDVADDAWQTLDYDHWNGILKLGVLSPTLLPGTTVGGFRIDRIEYTIAGDKITAQAWEPRDEGARIDRDIAALGRGAVRPFDFLALYTGVTSAQSGQAFDIKPDDDRLPGMSKVPIRHGFPGLTVTVANGAKILVGWQNGDPRLPYCALWGGGETVQAATMVADKIQLGADGLVAAQNGVVLGLCVDPFSGATHFALGGASVSVMAKP